MIGRVSSGQALSQPLLIREFDLPPFVTPPPTKLTPVVLGAFFEAIVRTGFKQEKGQFSATRYPVFSASAALLNATVLCGATWL